MQTAIVNLPFPGFYESRYSAAIDWEETSFIEYHCSESGETDSDYEPHWPKELQLDESEYAEILIRVTQYRIAEEKIAAWYVSALDYALGEALGFSVADTRQRWQFVGDNYESVTEEYMRPSIRATFESMDSPREYNFTTDRVYANIPLGMLYLLFRKSRAENHATLAAVIAERFTSRSGFISHYSRHLAEWLEKPLSDWDHNETGTLLIAAMRMAGVDAEDGDDEIYYATLGDCGAYEAWESAVDWPKFETMRAERRAELLAEWCESDIEAAATWRANHAEDFAALLAADSTISAAFAEHDGSLPYRCPETIDLFTGLPG